MKKLRVGIVGVTGYSGLVLLEILLSHPGVDITFASAGSTTGEIADIWPQLKGKTSLICEEYSEQKIIQSCDAVFLAVPHTVAMQYVPALITAGITVIDLSGDYRLNDEAEYKKWYKAGHSDIKNLSKAIYGLPELYRDSIKSANLISNPGCYPTAAILALAPIIKNLSSDIDSIVIDAKSGVTGAGRKAHTSLLYSEVNENFKAYKVFAHQHSPEIDLYLADIAKGKIKTTFVTHLLPMNRGILETIYVKFKSPKKQTSIRDLYEQMYKAEPFVRLLEAGSQPETKHVAGTNYCDLAIESNDDGSMYVVTTVIDNLMKGASGQAVQNMNIRFGYSEQEGLI